jgi:hypothetical protein
MGAAKREWYALRRQPCICGLGQEAFRCCWTSTGWIPKPARIDLRATGHTGSHKKCYLRDLGSCSEKLSGEHIISATVLREIGEDKVQVTGTPWLPKGESREIGISSLVSNCLCEAHNNALSPLDAAAGQFYRVLRDCLLDDAPPFRTYKFSGHDIERWLLKTTAGLAASKYLGADGEVLPNKFLDTVNIAQLLQDHTAWHSPIGMYVLVTPGKQFQVRNELQVAPLASQDKEIGGLITVIHGLVVSVWLESKDRIPDTDLRKSIYRFEKLNMQKRGGQKVVEFCWIDRLS